MYTKIKGYVGNVPIKLIATVLVAIFIPSVLVTALGLVTVFQADRFVKDFVGESHRRKLEDVRASLEQVWKERVESLEMRLHDAHVRGPYLGRVREDPYVRDIFWSDWRGVHAVGPAPPVELLSDLDDPELVEARRLEAAGTDPAAAYARYVELLGAGRDAVLVEALLGAARTSRALGAGLRALGYLERALEAYGHTLDASGVLRKVPILFERYRILAELGSPEAAEAGRRLARELEANRAWVAAGAVEMYRTSLPPGTVPARAEPPAPGAPRPDGDAGTGPVADARVAEALEGAARRLGRGSERDLRRVRLDDGRELALLSFESGSDEFRVHLVLESGAFAADLEYVLDERGVRPGGVRARPGPHPAGSAVPALVLASTTAPSPFTHWTLEYLPEPGALPVGFRSFEVLTLATFTWAVILLVLTIIVGVFYTLRYVLREMKTARLKADFVSFISHELKTPLAAIRMFTETLLEGRVADKDEEKMCLRLIDRETDRLSGLVDRVLAYAKVERRQKVFHFTSCNMMDVVHEAVELFHQHTKDRPRDVEVHSVQRVSNIQMDRTSMVEVVLNLLSNASKYSPADKPIVVNVRESMDEIAVDVIDRGVGIPRRDQKRVFEKFFRSNDYLTREVEGTGLGLAFARYIARVHNGEIKVSSQVNSGSTFTVQLRKTHVLAE